ncbi:MAG: hypothetical protein AAGG51_11475 [Cyanobacteria bacterium P01_G01_bin.54]
MASPRVAHFVAISDLSQAPESQEGLLVTVEGRGGDTKRNRTQALDRITQMWENGNIAEHLFPDGISQANLQFVPPLEDFNSMSDAPETASPELAPIVQGAREIIELTKLQIEAQEAAQEASPYVPIIQAVIERSRPLTDDEKTLAKEKKYGKIIERFGAAIAKQEEYQAQCTGNSKLVLNAIAWHQEQTQLTLPQPDDSEE